MTTTSGGDALAPAKVMRLRYAGTCGECGSDLEAGTRAGYLKATKTVRCLPCLKPHEPVSQEAPAATPMADPTPEPTLEPIETGSAGSSARREYERRSAKREARIREAHPRLGGLILAVTDEPQSTTAWASGARGEELLGTRLADLTQKGVRLLHDRRIPGTRANIDHIAVGPTGVHAIDAKRYKGRRPTLRVEGGLFRPRVEKLLVGSRDCTRLVDGMHKQVGLVRSALDAVALTDVPVLGALCFIESDWPLIGGSFVIADVAVLWPKKLAERLVAPGAMSEAEVEAVHRALAQAFPAA
ncbi:hypothetical protein N866_00475 [Actinotalea ferrariae CF5-4]|uniref:NERD domain-containing protein n=1 Tax=Actinotalea ferrariae CF5-4 TaxID=948458 RepID=A0A021VVY2_9CELL|nr:nuclease-related domain-containing protein [Actinotalea ferrariae]EYR65283.1 hypothetical protein N866_00475 [Actinotalea ferrariae CF5-4]